MSAAGSRRPVALALGFALASPGCGGYQPGPGRAPDMLAHLVGGPVPLPATVSYRLQPGPATTIRLGAQAGYSVTATTGGAYRVTWTGQGGTSGSFRYFWGSLYTPGAFTGVVPGCAAGECPLAPGDRIGVPADTPGGQRIDFDSVAADAVRGVDLYLTAEPLYLDVRIDGQRYPQLCLFPAADRGGAVRNSDYLPFGLVTR